MLVWLFENTKKKSVTFQKFGKALVKSVYKDHTNTLPNEILKRLDDYYYGVDRANPSEPEMMQQLMQIEKDAFGHIWSELVEVDPSPEAQCKYIPWIVNRYLYGGFGMWEDMQRCHLALTDFHDMITRRVFQNMPDDNPYKPMSDINRFKALRDLEKFLREFKAQNKDMSASDQKFIENVKALSQNGGLDLVWSGNNNTTFIVKLNTVEASSALFAQRTSWCTAPHGNTYFDNYSEDGPLYAFADITHDWYYQLHPQSGQLMDKDDHRVGNINDFPFTQEMWLSYVNHILGINLTSNISEDNLYAMVKTVLSNDYDQLVTNLHDADTALDVLRQMYLKHDPNASEDALNDHGFMLSMITLKLQSSDYMKPKHVLDEYGDDPRFTKFITGDVKTIYGIPANHQMDDTEIKALWEAYHSHNRFRTITNIGNALIDRIDRFYGGDVTGIYGTLLRHLIPNYTGARSRLSDYVYAQFVRYHGLRVINGEEFINLTDGDPTLDEFVKKNNPFKNGRVISISHITDPEFAKDAYREYSRLKDNSAKALIDKFGIDHPDVHRMMTDTTAMRIGFVPSVNLEDAFMAATGDITNEEMLTKYPRGSKMYNEYRDSLHAYYIDEDRVFDNNFGVGGYATYGSWFNKVFPINNVSQLVKQDLAGLSSGSLSAETGHINETWKVFCEHIEIFKQSNGKSFVDYVRKLLLASNDSSWNVIRGDASIEDASDDAIMDYLFKSGPPEIKAIISKSHTAARIDAEYAAATKTIIEYLTDNDFTFLAAYNSYSGRTKIARYKTRMVAARRGTLIGDIRQPEAQQEGVLWEWVSTREELDVMYDEVMSDSGYITKKGNIFSSDLHNYIGGPMLDKLEYPEIDPDELKKQWDKLTAHLVE